MFLSWLHTDSDIVLRAMCEYESQESASRLSTATSLKPDAVELRTSRMALQHHEKVGVTEPTYFL